MYILELSKLAVMYVGIFCMNYVMFEISGLFKKERYPKVAYILIFLLLLLICMLINNENSMLIYLTLMLLYIIIFMNKKILVVTFIGINLILYYGTCALIAASFIIIGNVNIYLLPSDNFYKIFFSLVVCMTNLLFALILNHFAKKIGVTKYFNMYKNNSNKHSRFTIVIIINASSGGLLMYVNSILTQAVRPGENLFVVINVFIYLLFLASNVLIAFIYSDFLRSQLLIQKRSDASKNLDKSTKDIDDMLTTLRNYKHDIVNIISGARLSVANGNIEDVEKYFDENISPITDDCEKFIERAELFNNIEITPLRSLLASKIAVAESRSIEVNIEIRDKIKHIDMDVVDLTRIIGILFDNSIEATTKCNDNSKKCIRIAIVASNGTTSFIIMNTCSEPIPPIYKMKQSGFSTKGENRGLGLSSLEKIMNGYNNATFEMEIENNKIIVGIHITEKNQYIKNRIYSHKEILNKETLHK